MKSLTEMYQMDIDKGEKNYPDLEDRTCPKCGWLLVRGSINYHEGFHFDGCPTDEVED